MSTRCHACKKEVSGDLLKCKHCGAWALHDIDAEGRPKKEQKVIPLNKVVSAEHDRLKIGHLDAVFGGGLVKTSVNLVGAPPGTGKSTLMLQTLDMIAGLTRENTLYVTGEEVLPEIRARADRLDLRNQGRILMLNAYENIDLHTIMMQVKPRAAVIDSVQAIAESEDHQVAVCKALKSFAGRYGCPMLVISQMTKDEDFSGLNAMQHVVDATFTFWKAEGAEEFRCFESRKNRFGPAPVRSWFEMTGKGLLGCEEPPDDDEE